jgi:hypothetical protein
MMSMWLCYRAVLTSDVQSVSDTNHGHVDVVPLLLQCSGRQDSWINVLAIVLLGPCGTPRAAVETWTSAAAGRDHGRRWIHPFGRSTSATMLPGGGAPRPPPPPPARRPWSSESGRTLGRSGKTTRRIGARSLWRETRISACLGSKSMEVR